MKRECTKPDYLEMECPDNCVGCVWYCISGNKYRNIRRLPPVVDASSTSQTGKSGKERKPKVESDEALRGEVVGESNASCRAKAGAYKQKERSI